MKDIIIKILTELYFVLLKRYIGRHLKENHRKCQQPQCFIMRHHHYFCEASLRKYSFNISHNKVLRENNKRMINFKYFNESIDLEINHQYNLKIFKQIKFSKKFTHQRQSAIPLFVCVINKTNSIHVYMCDNFIHHEYLWGSECT